MLSHNHIIYIYIDGIIETCTMYHSFYYGYLPSRSSPRKKIVNSIKGKGPDIRLMARNVHSHLDLDFGM